VDLWQAALGHSKTKAKTPKTSKPDPARGTLIAKLQPVFFAIAVVGAAAVVIATRRTTPAPVAHARSTVFSASRARESQAGQPRRGYLGVAACRECHEERVESFCQTSHYRAMFVANRDTMMGHFTPPKNVLRTRRDDLHYEATAEGENSFITSTDSTPAGPRTRRQRIDLIMGSGKIAQSYLYWQGAALYQVPIIYFTTIGEWFNPPGFPDTRPRWERVINPRCLECHATYFEETAGMPSSYHASTAVLEISCERCHGPGSAHVAYHRDHPEADKGVHIVPPASLARERQLDVCAQCHGEVGTSIKPSFTYTPGEPLDEYLRVGEDESSSAFVHTVNQLQRLRQSKCFQGSPEMTCTTCHDPHVHERDELETFSARCLKCHEAQTHKDYAIMGDAIVSNCIDCHMPLSDDESTPFFTEQGDNLKLIQLHDHLIATYPDVSRRILAAWQSATAQEIADPIWREAGEQARAALREVDVFLKLDRRDDAMRALAKALSHRPNDVIAREQLGRLLLEDERLDEAIAQFREALRAKPQHVEISRLLAKALLDSGRVAEAVVQYREMLQFDPASQSTAAIESRQRLAWILATHPEDEARNGAEAVALAEVLCRQSNDQDWIALDTLAAAYAENEQYDKAVDAARRAAELCRAVEDLKVVDEVKRRLDLYQRRLPYRSPQRRAGES